MIFYLRIRIKSNSKILDLLFATKNAWVQETVENVMFSSWWILLTFTLAHMAVVRKSTGPELEVSCIRLSCWPRQNSRLHLCEISEGWQCMLVLIVIGPDSDDPCGYQVTTGPSHLYHRQPQHQSTGPGTHPSVTCGKLWGLSKYDTCLINDSRSHWQILWEYVERGSDHLLGLSGITSSSWYLQLSVGDLISWQSHQI